MPELMTMSQVCRVLKVSESTGYRLVWDEAIPSCKVGRQLRIRRDDLITYISKKSRQRTGVSKAVSC